jgi:hypothetical protein
MASHSVQQQFATFTLPELMRQVYRGNLLLMADDESSWDDTRRVELFEAIYRGVPMGGITQCRTTLRFSHAGELGGIPVGDGDEDEAPRDYVLEGSDRLRVLFEVFGESFWLADHRHDRRPRAPNPRPRTRITFDLRARTFQLRGDEPKPPWEFSLSSLMHAENRHAFITHLEARPDGERLVNRLNRLVSAFYEYPIPVITFVSNDAERVSSFLTLRNSRMPRSLDPKPSTTFWVCDECKTPIRRPEDGVVEWLEEPDETRVDGHGLRLVHQSAASPRPNGCQYNEEEFALSDLVHGDLSLKDFLGDDGLTHLLNFLSEERHPKAEILEMIKRLHTPGYERARFHFEAAESAGVIEPTLAPRFLWMREIAAILEWADKKKLKP